jgi:hypothetical protein
MANQWLAQGLLAGGVQFKLLYTGSSVGVWTGVSPLIFTPGSWTFTVTQTAWIMLKACGPGGYGGLAPVPNTTICGGGGGGAYTLGSGYSFKPGITYTVVVSAAGSVSPTYMLVEGVEWILHLGGGATGMRWDQAPAGGAAGGIVSAGIAGQNNGGNGGRWNPTIYPANTSGPAGGGFGGNGNGGGTGAWAGSAGGSGESGAGAASSPPGGYNGGCGGYGAGLVVGGYPYGRGGGGAGEVGNTGVPVNDQYVLAATSGVIQLTKV